MGIQDVHLARGHFGINDEIEGCCQGCYSTTENPCLSVLWFAALQVVFELTASFRHAGLSSDAESIGVELRILN
jgi:hypothetical protein